MKEPHGHYCLICGQHKANEKFSSRGHAAHICKACAKRGNKSPVVVAEASFVDEDEPIILHEDATARPKKKRNPNKEKLLRSAQKKQAKELLIRMLVNGEKPVSEIQRAAANAHIPIEALHRAKGSLGIRAVSTENGSIWRLPYKETISTVDASIPTTEDQTTGKQDFPAPKGRKAACWEVSQALKRGCCGSLFFKPRCVCCAFCER